MIRHSRWLRTAFFAGVLYFAAGFGFGALAGAAASDPMRSFWRVTAFIVSGVVFALHIAYEHFRLGSPARSTAWHASVGAAVGGFLLALAANLHDLGSASGYRPRMVIAFVVWPLLTAVPAFVVAWLVAAVFRLRRQAV